MPYKDQETIKFRQTTDFDVEILDMNGKLIGRIFSKGSCKDENSIQICGFNRTTPIMGCYIWKGRDVCLIWDNMEKAGKRSGEETRNIMDETIDISINNKPLRCSTCLEKKSSCFCKVAKTYVEALIKHDVMEAL